MRKELRKLADQKMNMIYDEGVQELSSEKSEGEESEEDELGPDLFLDLFFDGETEYDKEFLERYHKWLCYEGLLNSAQRNMEKVVRSNSIEMDYARGKTPLEVKKRVEYTGKEEAKSQHYFFSTYQNVCFTDSKPSPLHPL